MEIKRRLQILTVIIMLLGTIALAYAENNEPLGAETVTEIQAETANLSLYDPDSHDAEAGNVTELLITGVSQTKTWQGYYGNITGTIILEDSQKNRFYDWDAAEPQGEIYATVNNTITWTDVACANLSDDTYLSSWNTFYGITPNDYDSINLTYNYTDHPEFYAGTSNMTGCPTAYTFVNDAMQETDFPTALLTTNTESTMIFTAIIEDRADGTRAGKTGFDGADHDFQVLVAENGQLGNDDLTTYYFYVEIE